MATPTPASTGPLCPACRAPVTPGARFCPACGASLTAPAGAGSSSPGSAPTATAPSTSPSSANAPPVDIRTTVDQNQGVLKRLQLLVPGFRGYRQTEDLRAADSLLRRQVADKVGRARGTVESVRSSLTQAGQFQHLTDLAPLIADLQRLEGEIRHAEQGYTGISPAVRVNTQTLDRMYEYDYGFALAGTQLGDGIEALPAVAGSGDASALGAAIATARGRVSQLDSAFRARLKAVEQIQV